MMKLSKLIGTTAIGAAVSLAALFGAVGSAQAKSYAGDYHPEFGTPFDDLVWSGTGTFTIPDACRFGPQDVWKANTGPCSGGGMSITDGTLKFENKFNPLIVESFTFNLPPVNAMYVTGNELKGVYSEYIGVFHSAIWNDVGGTPVDFFLRFEKQIAGPDSRSVVQLYYVTQGEGSACLTEPTCVHGGSLNMAELVLTPVPEPETYALMLGGLVAVGVYARRRNR